MGGASWHPIDLKAVRQTLQELGWEAVVGQRPEASDTTEGLDQEELVARRGLVDDHSVWTLALDRAGRLRLTVTEELQAPSAGLAHMANREYRLLQEDRRTLTITGFLPSVHAVPQMVDDLDHLVAAAAIRFSEEKTEPQA